MALRILSKSCLDGEAGLSPRKGEHLVPPIHTQRTPKRHKVAVFPNRFWELGSRHGWRETRCSSSDVNTEQTVDIETHQRNVFIGS